MMNFWAEFLNHMQLIINFIIIYTREIALKYKYIQYTHYLGLLNKIKCIDKFM